MKFTKDKSDNKNQLEKLDKIEVNILIQNKIIHTALIDIEAKEFDYHNTKYTVESKAIYLYPSDKGFIPTSFYHEGNPNPIKFKDDNKGIPSRALHLLWNHTLYKVLVTLEKDKTNLIIIILLIVNIILFCIRLYLNVRGLV